jgi:hypothetical protein
METCLKPSLSEVPPGSYILFLEVLRLDPSSSLSGEWFCPVCVGEMGSEDQTAQTTSDADQPVEKKKRARPSKGVEETGRGKKKAKV